MFLLGDQSKQFLGVTCAFVKQMDSERKKVSKVKRKREIKKVDQTKNFKGGHSIMELPNDCLRTICSFLNRKELSNFSLTSKDIHTLIFGSIENAYNRKSVKLFHNRVIYEALEVTKSVRPRMDSMMAMRRKLDNEIHKIRQTQHWDRVKNNSQCAGFIHEISNWDFQSVDGTIEDLTHVKIEFDWTRELNTVHFDFEYVGEGDCDDWPAYVLCAKFGLDPSTGRKYNVLVLSVEMDQSPLLDRTISHDTAEQALIATVEFLDPKMKQIDLMYSLYHLLLMEPYPFDEMEDPDDSLAIEVIIKEGLRLYVQEFHFLYSFLYDL